MDSFVISNLTHHRGRTAASIAGVSVGVLLVVLTVGLVRGMLRERGERDAQVGAEIFFYLNEQQSLSFTSLPLSIPIETVGELRAIPGVASASPIGQDLELKGESGIGLRQVDGVEFADYQKISGVHVVSGEALPASGDFAMVDSREGAKPDRRVGATIEALGRTLKIVGIYDPPAGARLKVPLTTMQEAREAVGRCSMILVKCHNPAAQKQVAEAILARNPSYRVMFTQDIPDLFATGFTGFNVFLNLVAGLAAVISMLVILLTMYTTVTERTRQIGILKSLGASRTFIASEIQKEALTITGLGVLGGLGLAMLARAFLVSKLGYSIEMSPTYILGAAIAGLLSGSLGALYPAWRAASQDPVTALSYE